MVDDMLNSALIVRFPRPNWQIVSSCRVRSVCGRERSPSPAITHPVINVMLHNNGLSSKQPLQDIIALSSSM